MSKTLTLLFILIFSQAFPQTVFELDQSKTILFGGAPIRNPFSQGINSAQIQTIDLTGDGVEEWVTWDINSGQLQVFAKDGEKFTHLPELSYYFPADISGFLVLADFDGDGKKDLFTSTPLGIKAYRNTSQGGQISWTVAQNYLRLDGANNIPANNLDTPLLQDLDGDGDLDLVLFNFAQGDFLEFFRNTSVERKGSADIDGFAFPVDYWGNFVFCACGEFAFGQRCDGRPIDFRIDPNENDRILHAGGHSILYQDFDGDDIPDLLLGRDECNTLYFLPNSGTSDQPLFTEFSNEVPPYGGLPHFPRFHVGQWINGELVISLNTNEASASYNIDFAQSVFWGNPAGTFAKPILQNQLYDLGENTRPLFRGNESFGELWITSNQIFSSGAPTTGRATHFRYSDGAFIPDDENFGNLSLLNLLDIQLIEHSAADGAQLFLASGIRRTNGIPSQVIYRSAGENWEEFSLPGLTLRTGDQLEFFSFRGKDQLLVAAQNGSLTLYDVDFEVGSVTLNTANFLGFQDNPANRNLAIALTSGETPNLYSVDQTGRIFLIRDFMNSDVREEVLVKIGSQNLPLRLGRNTWITLVKPDFSEVPDLILGTRGGGIVYLKATTSEFPNENEFLAKLFPNPSSGPTTVITNQGSTGQLVNSLGQILMDQLDIPANREVILQTQILSPGLYFLQLESENKQVLVKKILIR
ncbi:T9SS type A sorting domain-containing protein [Algoriphagus aestuariicola]|uniref:T9SS type A sorting domain-containing protein n=1 Tax=Algoriphagus aestuariicola TaxID=1852016 RepID=A0ABS3BUN6_9BACT|nr:FG-GAP-like repeat-containing protein [Algoriphagus aestuariicola]MBN7802792.1 T9SS type A sorting domain-containing protein [Algoriphagus aestuariicola]